MEECLDLDSRPELVRAARRFVERTLGAWEMPEYLDEALLVASELVTNSILHARTDLRLTLRSDGVTGVRVEVYDENSRMPNPAWAPTDATSGRGLNAVAVVASTWGAEDRGDGKVVWAQLGNRPAGQQGVLVDVGRASPAEDSPSHGSGDRGMIGR